MAVPKKSTGKFFGFTLEDLETAFRLIKKHGPIPVLAIWLWVDHGRLNRVENQLYDCYQIKSKKADLFQHNMPKVKANTLLAVLPTKQKLIQSDND